MNFEATTRLPMEYGTFEVSIFTNEKGEDVVAIHSGEISEQHNLPVRVHSSCFTSEVLGSQKCDCKQQLDYALKYIFNNGGMVIYLQQEGRGIGLSNKMRAYALQEKGIDTIQANTMLGLPVDARTYEDARDVLDMLKVSSIRLMTNNPDKLSKLSTLGVQVTGRIPVPATPTFSSIDYLDTKQKHMGHLIKTRSLYDSASTERPAAEHENRPMVHVNFAITPESQVADENGQCTSISCDKDWQRVHELREKYDAIAVGANTWLQDSPKLTSRSNVLGRQPQRQPTRVIFCGHHSCSVDAESIDRKTVLVGNIPPSQTSNKVIRTTNHNLVPPLQELHDMGIRSLLVEGGPTLLKSFIEQKLADQLTVYVSGQDFSDAIQALLKLIPSLAADEITAEYYGDGVLLTALLNQRNEPEINEQPVDLMDVAV